MKARGARAYRWLLVCGLALGGEGVRAGAPSDPVHVLLLQSYHSSFPWSRNVELGLQDALARQGLSVRLHSEYLDMKNLSGRSHWDSFWEALRRKGELVDFQVVVASDNDALDFIVEHQEGWLADVPVVFCGINGFSPELLRGRGKITGVVEQSDLAATVDVALRLNPALRRLYVLGDDSTTGLALREEAARLQARLGTRLDWKPLYGRTLSESVSVLAAEQEPSAVLMLTYNRDADGRILTYKEVLDRLNRQTPWPVYGLWDFLIGQGIVGGRVISGRDQGAEAGALAVRILAGEAAENLPVLKESPNRYAFDYRQLVSHRLPLDVLPPDSELSYESASLWRTHAGAVSAVAGVLLAMAVALLGLLSGSARRRRIEEALQRAYTQLHREAHDHQQAREALTQSESRLRYLFTHAPVSIWEVDFSEVYAWLEEERRQGLVDLQERLSARRDLLPDVLSRVRVLDVNEATFRMLDAANRDELLAGLDKLAGGDGYRAFTYLLLAIWQRCTQTTAEFRGLSLRGRPVEGALHFSAPEVDGHIDWRRSIVVLIDLTARREAERALESSEERFRNLAERARVIPWEAEVATGRVIYIGPQAREFLGYSMEDWYTDGFWRSHLHPEDRDEVERFRAVALQERAQFEQEYRLLAEDGRPLWFRDVVYVVRDQEGPRKLRGFLVDISALKDAEHILRDSQVELERRVEERTAELRRLVHAMAGREVRMHELKRVIAELNQQLRAHGLTPAATDRGGMVELDPSEGV